MAIDEEQLDQIAASVADLFRAVEGAVNRAVAARLKDGLASDPLKDKADALAKLRRSAEAIQAAMQKRSAPAIRQAIAEAYRAGRGGALTGVPANARVRRAAAAGADEVPNVATIERIAGALHSDLGRVSGNVLRDVQDAYRAVQSESAARIASGAFTRRQAAQAVWQRLVDKGITSFTDSRGRRWSLSAYAEMMTRTNVKRAAVEAHNARLAEVGLDLVYVQDVTQECRLCRPYEGKVLAVGPGARAGKVRVEHSINDDEYITVDVVATLDQAREAGLHHPNCRHSISAYLPGVTKLPTKTADPKGNKARERQRAIERAIRKYKARAEAAMTPEAKQDAEAQARAWQGVMRDHLKANPKLKRLPYRESPGAGNIPGRRGPEGGAVGDQRPPKPDPTPTPAAPASAAPAPRKPKAPAPAPAPAKPETAAPAPAKPKTPAAPKATPKPKVPKVPAKAAPYHRNVNQLDDLARDVKHAGDGEHTPLSGGQSAATELVKLPDGTRLVRKRGMDWGDPEEVAESVRSQADAEQLASLLGRALDAPVVKVYRQAVDEVWMPFLDGDVIGAVKDGHKLIRGRDGKLLGLIDHLIANGDRNSGNIMVHDGRLTGIDHGFSWGSHNLGEDGPVIQDGEERPASHYSRDGKWTDNPLTPQDVRTIRERLERLRPDFEHVGRGEWLDYSLRQLDRLAEHARGTENLFG